MIEKIKSVAVWLGGILVAIMALLLSRSQQKTKELEANVKSLTLDKEIENDLENGAKALSEYTSGRQSYAEWKATHGRGTKK